MTQDVKLLLLLLRTVSAIVQFHMQLQMADAYRLMVSLPMPLHLLMFPTVKVFIIPKGLHAADFRLPHEKFFGCNFPVEAGRPRRQHSQEKHSHSCNAQGVLI